MTGGDDTWVCICGQVTESELLNAYRAGCRTIHEVGQQTGAGQGCGDCHLDIEDLLHAAADQVPR